MSGVNIECTVGNQLGNGGGEMKFEVSAKENTNLATCIATELVNEILENALDIATMGGVTGLHCDTIAFSVDDGLCTFSSNFPKINSLEEINDECSDIKDIIDGLSAIHIPKNNLEEPMRLDVEMKRLLSEMMSPPYDIVNYETLSRKDGVGDQAAEDLVQNEDAQQPEEDVLVDVEKTKVVEKKTRVTDLVMNSKQVLSEYLLSEESRKQQEEWEETNEKVIQIIELDYVKPEENLKKDEEEIPEEIDVIEDEEVDFVELNLSKPDVVPNKDFNDIKDVTKDSEKGSNRNSTKDERQEGASGEKIEEIKTMPGSSTSKTNTLDAVMAKTICKRKIENLKKKKWHINLKFWGKKKQKEHEKDTKSVQELNKEGV